MAGEGVGPGGSAGAGPGVRGSVDACERAGVGPGECAAGATSNQFGRTSELRLVAVARGGSTVLADEYYTMPFKVMRPFAARRSGLVGAGEGAEAARVMVMSASAGVMAGDDQRIEVRVGSGAALQVTTQAFEKVHRMEGEGSARRVTRLEVEPGGYLDYRPQPQIPFAGSAYAATTEADLADGTSALVYEEVLSCGRVARGERFGYRSYRNHVLVRVGGAPVYLDNAIYEPRGSRTPELAPMGMEGMGLYEGFTHLANLVLVNVGVDSAAFGAARDYLREQTGVIGASAALPASAGADSEAVAGGITRLGSGDVAVRLLGRRAQRLTDVLERVRELLGASGEDADATAR